MGSIDFLGEDAFLLMETIMTKKHYLRQLSEKSNLAPSSVHKIMKKLSLKKMVLAEKQKNRKLFSLNYDSPLTRSVLRVIFVEKITSAKAFKKLLKLKPTGIHLFGTAASGKMKSDSDIDLAIYFKKKPDSLLLSKIKLELSNELKREIQLIVLTDSKIDSMKEKNTELLQQIKNKSIVLGGKEIE